MAARNLYELRKTKQIHRNALPPKTTMNNPFIPSVKTLPTSQSTNSSSSSHGSLSTSWGVIAKTGVFAIVAGMIAMPTAKATGIVTDTGTLNVAVTGTLDLKDNALIVRTTPYATIKGYVLSGFAAGAWNGFGVNSSAAASNNATLGVNRFAVGDADNSILLRDTFFGHSTVTHTQTLARYTYYGDNDLSGFVDADDFGILQDNFLTVQSNWLFGDYDGSGFVDADDFGLLQDNFLRAAIPPSPPAPPLPSGGSAVPEPGSLAMLAVGLVGLMSRRNRK